MEKWNDEMENQRGEINFISQVRRDCYRKMILFSLNLSFSNVSHHSSPMPTSSLSYHLNRHSASLLPFHSIITTTLFSQSDIERPRHLLFLSFPPRQITLHLRCLLPPPLQASLHRSFSLLHWAIYKVRAWAQTWVQGRLKWVPKFFIQKCYQMLIATSGTDVLPKPLKSMVL